MRHPRAFDNCCFCNEKLINKKWFHLSCRNKFKHFSIRIPDHIPEEQHEKFIVEKIKKLK